jgi:hypothetical protein
LLRQVRPAGQAGPQNHNKRFPQYQATQAETLQGRSAVKPAGLAVPLG